MNTALASGTPFSIDIDPEPLETDKRIGRLLRKVFARDENGTAAPTAEADSQQLTPITHTPDIVIYLDPSYQGNETILKATPEMRDRLLRRYVPCNSGVNLSSTLAEEYTAIINGVLFALLGITAGTAFNDCPMRGTINQLLDNPRGQEGAPRATDIPVDRDVGNVEIFL
jgi:hypothetical protein